MRLRCVMAAFAGVSRRVRRRPQAPAPRADTAPRDRVRRRLEPADLGGAAATDCSRPTASPSSFPYTPTLGVSRRSRCSTASRTSRTAAIDNLVAYQEGQGEAKIPDNPDLFAFMGGDSGFATIVAAPAVKSFAELKGKTLSVDAMTTGYAFVVRELVARNGLAETDVTFVRAGGTANRYRDLIRGQARCNAAAHAVRAPGARIAASACSRARNRSAPTRGRWDSRVEAGRATTRPRSSASCARIGPRPTGSTIAPTATSPRRCSSPTFAT